jgi:hypothetical protein
MRRARLARVSRGSGGACSDEADFGSRHGQHEAAVRKGGGSHFYNLYPSKGYVNALYASQRRGYFEDLTPFIAVAFDRNNAKMLITDIKDGKLQARGLPCKASSWEGGT